MLDQILGQGFGILAPILTVISYQLNTKKSILFAQTAASLFTAIGYFFLGAYSGCALNIICLIRNVVYLFLKENSKLRIPTVSVLSLSMIVFGILTWQGPQSLLIMIALAVNTVYLSFGKPQLLRKSILLTSSMMIVYNLIVFSVGGLLNESLAVASSAVGIIRFRKEGKTESK